jgi:hypothetical protein
MSSATYSVVVNVGDGRSEEQFTEKFTVTLDNKTIKELKSDWEKCKDNRREEGWETSQLVADMTALGYDFESVNQWDEIELDA